MSMNHDVSFVELATDVDTVDPCATDARLLSQLLAHTHIVNRHILTSHFGPSVQNDFETNAGSQLVSDHKKCTVFTFSQSAALNDVLQHKSEPTKRPAAD